VALASVRRAMGIPMTEFSRVPAYMPSVRLVHPLSDVPIQFYTVAAAVAHHGTGWRRYLADLE
jgi:hypothetical protein